MLIQTELQDLQSNIQQAIALHTQFLQQQVYFGHLTDQQDVGRYFYTLPGVSRVRNALISPSVERPLRIVNVVRGLDEAGLAEGEVPTLGTAEKGIGSDLLILVGNFTSEAGAESVNALLDLSVSQISSYCPRM